MEFEKVMTGRCFVKSARFREVISDCDVSEEIKSRLLSFLDDKFLLEDEDICSYQLGLAMGQFYLKLNERERKEFLIIKKSVSDGDKLPFFFI